MKWWIGLLLIMLLLIGCGGSSSGGGSATVSSIKIEPANLTIAPGESVQLTAVVNGTRQAVVWSVPAGFGTIDSQGRFVAPNRSMTVPVTVRLASDASRSSVQNITIDSKYVVQVTSPSSTGTPTVAEGETLNLSAVVQGASNNSVTWSVDQGSIDTNGRFTAPSTVPTEPNAVVTATSVADPGKSQRFTINLVKFIEALSRDGSTLSIPGSRVRFSARIRGAASSNVTWSASSGTITTDGVWTAGSSTGPATITATSTENSSKTSSINVNVQANLNVRFRFENKGDVVLALRPDKAPRHCANLVSLVSEGFYTDILLHRRENGFVVQWGCPFTKTLPLTSPQIGTGGPGYNINFEANDLLHTKYSLGMARSTGLDTAGSQIYICLEAQPSLDGNYVVFGNVLSGTAVVDELAVGDKITTASVEIP